MVGGGGRVVSRVKGLRLVRYGFYSWCWGKAAKISGFACRLGPCWIQFYMFVIIEP